MPIDRIAPPARPIIKPGLDLKIDTHSVKKAALILRAINHELRQKLIRLIHENKTINVTQLYVNLKIEQSVASQHLAILRRAGIISTRRQGKHKYYSVNLNRIDEINGFSEKL